MCSTFGNLESTTEWLEVVFNIIVLTSGLLLVTMLIGNIKVTLHLHMLINFPRDINLFKRDQMALSNINENNLGRC